MDSIRLECGICNHSFSEEHRPRILPCSHSLCGNCIDRIISASGSQCPFCRQSFEADSAEDLVINRDLLDVSLQFSSCRESERSKMEEPSLPKVLEDIKAKLQKGASNYQGAECQVLNAIETYKEMKAVALDSNNDIVRQISILEKLKSENDKTITNIDMQNGLMMYHHSAIVQQSKEIRESEARIETVRNFSTGGSLIDEAEIIFKGSQEKVKEVQTALPEIGCVDDFIKENLLVKMRMKKVERELVKENGNESLQDITVDDLSSFCGSSVKLRKGIVFAAQTAERGVRVANISFESNNQVLMSHLKDEVIPPKSFVIQHEVLMSRSSRTAFMDLGVDDKFLGRITIKITVEGNYALKFLHLCAGDLGPSYAKSRLSKRSYYGPDEHHMEVVEPKLNGQRSTDLVLPLVNWFDEEKRDIYEKSPYKAGDVRGVHSSGENARFYFVTRDNPSHIASDCFAVVEEGIDMLRSIESQYPDLGRVSIIDFGLIFSC